MSCKALEPPYEGICAQRDGGVAAPVTPPKLNPHRKFRSHMPNPLRHAFVGVTKTESD
jgi:hypothetical protein